MSTVEDPAKLELKLLKERADRMGIVYSNNIGLETLKAKVAEKLGDVLEPESEGDNAPDLNDDSDLEEVEDTEEEETVLAISQAPEPRADLDGQVINPIKKIKAGPALGIVNRGPQQGPTVEKAGRKLSLYQKQRNEQMKLVRCRIQNLDPKKADLPGEYITVANRFVGNVKKFIPYGEVTDDGWHIPYIIYKALERRRFLLIRTVKNKTTKQIEVKKSWAKEFSIEILPPLTPAEIKQLAVSQAASGFADSDSQTLNI